MRRYPHPLLTAALLCTLVAGCTVLRQSLGFALVPVETEIALGARIAPQIEQQEKVLANDKVQAYVKQVAGKLIAHSLQDRPEITYQVTVLDNPKQVNAFAIPGGHIYVFSGLLLAASNEAELAGVMAHEIGHVVGRHTANQLATQYGLELLTGLALGEDPNEIARIAAQVADIGALAHFSREDELESDKYGVKYLIAAGYDPRGLKTFFEKLAKEEGRRSGLENFLATHPPTAERIQQIDKLIAKAGNPKGRLEKERWARETASLRKR